MEIPLEESSVHRTHSAHNGLSRRDYVQSPVRAITDARTALDLRMWRTAARVGYQVLAGLYRAGSVLAGLVWMQWRPAQGTEEPTGKASSKHWRALGSSANQEH